MTDLTSRCLSTVSRPTKNALKPFSSKRKPVGLRRRCRGCPALASPTGLADGLGPRVTLVHPRGWPFAPELVPPLSRSREIRRLRRSRADTSILPRTLAKGFHSYFQTRHFDNKPITNVAPHHPLV